MTDTPDERATREAEPAEKPAVDAARQRQIRRRQLLLALAALLGILIFAMVQGYLGAPDKIPGTH